MMDVKTFARNFIFVWEDGSKTDPAKTHSMDPKDSGNWSGSRVGKGILIGSNHGVTPQVLADHRKVPVGSITYQMMHDLTMDEAVDIALAEFFYDKHMDRLHWGPVIASVFDFGYTAGDGTAMQELQELIGATADGSAGPKTAAAYDAWILKVGSDAPKLWAAKRTAYYIATIQRHPEKAKYKNGWNNRTNYYLPGDANGWWKKFNA